ncbi:glycosyltransferase [Nostoc sp. PCC 7524]|uniref:glycosyltransferase family 4 protein n=1 Tax=Nostoc sp. (strain ATCC 29411 / PCC 7524) TaxID=28072 RepID=UPI00029F06FE|nr:glycosyltransferase family 4 protein [Nostoc sp. PCC 7524]AFY47770.1 glycosyltransferase [Nostoc sp. PCC 7524]
MTASQSNQITVLMLPDNRDANPYQALLAKSLEEYGVKVNFPQGYRRFLPLIREVIYSQQRYDLIHLHWILPYLKGKNSFFKLAYTVKFLLDVALVKLAGVKIVWTIHNRVNHDSHFPAIELWLRRNLAKMVDSIILHNQATLEVIAQEYQFSPQKASVILHGHYRDVYHPPIEQSIARQKLDLPSQGYIFLNLGLLRPYKGIEKLIDTWSKNQDVFSQHTLLIAGKADSIYATKLQQKIVNTKGIALIPEFIDEERIHLFFSAATVVVLPYENILNSGSLILAMTYGLPVIAPRIGSIPEYLGNADQLLYEADDISGLFKSMDMSLKNDLRQLSQDVIKACDRLNWNKIAQDTAKTYCIATASN